MLSGLQDRLAPLKSWLLPQRVYLQLEDQAFTAMVLDGKRVAWKERVPLPEGLCVNGAPTAVDALGDLLGDLLVERGYPGARVTGVLPRDATTWRVIEWPESVWPESPELLVRQHQQLLDLPWPLEDVDLFLDPLLGEPPRSLLLAVQRELLEAWIGVFHQAGVALDGLKALPICLWRAIEPQLGEGVQVLLQLEQTQCWLLAWANDQPLGDWSLPGAGDPASFAEALQQWSQRFAPSGAILSTTDAALQGMLPELQHWMGCTITGSQWPCDELPLWGLVQIEIQR